MDKKDIEKYIKKINKTPKTKPPLLTRILTKILVCLVLFLSISILYKTSPTFQENFTKTFYKNINFAKVKKLYNKYLGGIFPLEKFPTKTETVFSEKLKYISKEPYKDGVKLEVDNNYLVPTINSGMVAFIGDKEDYGKTIIIKGEDGIDIWYAGINNPAVKLYDYVEKGTFLGETTTNTLYLVFSKDSEILNYEKHLD